jgi:hypothetical protein
MVNYKCTFGLKEWEFRRDAKVNAKSAWTVQEYCSPIYRHGSQLMRNYINAFTFINKSIVILRGLIWLFIFKSVSLSRRYAETLLHIASWSSYPSSWSPSQSSFVLTMLLYTRNLIPKVPARILRKHCQITFLRTFGSRRPPTSGMLPQQERMRQSSGPGFTLLLIYHL